MKGFPPMRFYRGAKGAQKLPPESWAARMYQGFLSPVPHATATKSRPSSQPLPVSMARIRDRAPSEPTAANPSAPR